MAANKSPKIVVISSNPSSSEFEVVTDEDEEESVLFKGHASYNSSSHADSELDSDEYEVTDGTDDSDVDDDYIQNMQDNGDGNILEILQNMNLAVPSDDENPSSSDCSDSDVQHLSSDVLDDDEAFAAMATEREFLLDGPTTFMEFSLDETAAEFLAQKRRPLKGKNKGKGKKQMVAATTAVREPFVKDPFDYDGPYTMGTISFRQYNREIKAFINDDIEDSLEFDPMPPLPRKFLHELAHQYGLKSKSAGQGRDRHCVLYKTERSCLPRNVKALGKLVDRADQAVLWMDKSVTKGKKFTQASVPSDVKEGRVRPGKKGKKSKDSNSELAPSAKPAIGTVIGKNAKPISEDNIGNKLLQKLGWKPGQALGHEASSNGILLPVEAVVRGKRTGLGHGAE